MRATLLSAYLLTAITAYIFGSIPFGFLIARAKGIDIRTVGSRNIGATNVFRGIGKGLGALTLLLDVGKGLAGTLVIPNLFILLLGDNPEPHQMPLTLLGGALVVAGHNWTLFLGFRGGKGVATGIGVLFGLAPAAAAAMLGAWLVFFTLFGYVSLASICASAGIILLGWLLYFDSHGPLLPSVLSLLGIITILRHHSNIKRLFNRTEPRMWKRNTSKHNRSETEKSS